MKNITKLLAVLACCLFLSCFCLLASGCDDEKTTDETATSATEQKTDAEEETAADYTLLTEGTIVFATSPDYPPFENLENGEYVGFEMDLARAIAEKMGLKCEFSTLQFDNIIPAVVAGGKCDAAIAAFSVDPERAKEIDYSDSYYTDDQAVAVMKGTFTDDSALNAEGVIIAAQTGTSCEDYALENYPNATYKGYGNANDCFAALQAGQVDAVVTNAAVGNKMVSSSYTDAEIIKSVATGEEYALIISQDNPELTKAINAAIAELKADGTIDEIMAQWF